LALVHAALRLGKKLGYRAAVLGATGMGARVYARAGFREVCKLSFWRYGKVRQVTLPNLYRAKPRSAKSRKWNAESRNRSERPRKATQSHTKAI
jgi:hypothetical protein